MGYRSEVVLAISPEAASAFMALCAKHPEVMQLCHDADVFKSGYEQPGDYFMHWSSIKWYEDYTDIAALQEFIEHLESDDLTEFVRRICPELASGMSVSSLSVWAKTLTITTSEAMASLIS